MNDGIRVRTVKLINDAGEQQVVTKEEALAMAKEAGLDLLIVAPNLEPPVAKLLDYGHYRYEKEKKQKEARKKNVQKGSILKELKLTPRIGIHDFNVRVKQGREFLTKGYKVRLTVFFKGREATHPELGNELIMKYLGQIEDLGWMDGDRIPRVLGRVMSVTVIAGLKRAKNVVEAPRPVQVPVAEPQTQG